MCVLTKEILLQFSELEGSSVARVLDVIECGCGRRRDIITFWEIPQTLFRVSMRWLASSVAYPVPKVTL